jgi:hypothetical protein
MNSEPLPSTIKPHARTMAASYRAKARDAIRYARDCAIGRDDRAQYMREARRLLLRALRLEAAA